MRKFGVALFFIAAILCACSATAAATKPSHATGQSPELDRLLEDACAKSIVLLGEDANHGGGRTLELKVRLVERLVDECGFSAVFFESPIYDFLDLAQAFGTKTATPQRLADALGGLWSTTREIDPLVSFLYAKAAAGQMRLAGLGPAIGEATALYARKRMPVQLVRDLPEPRRSECETALLRYGSWEYDDAHPYGSAVEAELKTCVSEIEAATATRRGPGAAEARVMAANASRHFEMSSDGGKDFWERRDRAMAENFEWLRARLPRQAKIIVWCATVHAAKRLPADAKRRNPMGSYIHRRLGDDAFAIGFTALSGRIGPLGRPPLELAAAPGSLEQRALANSTDELRYLDREQLTALGALPAHPLDYSKIQSADWSTVVDGLVVLREERPVERVRPAKPQQVE